MKQPSYPLSDSPKPAIHETMAYFAFYKQQSTLENSWDATTSPLWFQWHPPAHLHFHHQAVPAVSKTLRPEKQQFPQLNAVATVMMEPMKNQIHSNITALLLWTDLKWSCTAESAQHLLGPSPISWLGRNMEEWLKQPNSAWAFPSTAGSRRLKSWAVIWPADGDSSLWIGLPCRRLLSPR